VMDATEEITLTTPQLRFLGGHDFVSQEPELDPPLVGSAEDCLLPRAGLCIVGGEGGAGKTTVTLDAIAHFATGAPWLGVPIGAPLRIGIIENEGPQAPFVAKVNRYAEAWEGDDFLERTFFLTEPWARFTLTDDGLRAALRGAVEELELDMLVCDPLGRFGIAGVGSPEETRAFLGLLGDVGCQRDVAFWLLHHINKSRQRSIVQALSGDWGGHPDLILGVEHEEGQRITKLTYGKVRWGDAGRRPALLAWLPESEGIGYRLLADAALGTGSVNRQKVLDAIDGGLTTAAEIATVVGLGARAVTKHMKALGDAGRIRLENGPNNTYLASPIDPEDEPGLEEPVRTGELEWR
jgi:DNA-binding transcriptional ArsR family regulator